MTLLFSWSKTKWQILIEQVLCSIADDLRNPNEARWWVCSRSEVRFPKASLANYGDKFLGTPLVMTELVTLVDVCTPSSGRSAHTRNSALYDIIQGHTRKKKTFRNLYKPEGVYLAQKILHHTSNSFLETLAMFSMGVQLMQTTKERKSLIALD